MARPPSSETSPPCRSYRRVAQILADEMNGGTHPVGARLPPERVLAGRFGVSRTTVREAMIALEVQGLVSIRQGSGITVIALPGASPTDSGIGPFELLEARIALEGEAAFLAATRISEEELQSLSECCRNAEAAAENSTERVKQDQKFHDVLARACRNRVMERQVVDLWGQRERSTLWQRLHSMSAQLQGKESWSYDHEAVLEHRRILRALRRRDPEAARTEMRAHLENVRQALLNASEVESPAEEVHEVAL